MCLIYPHLRATELGMRMEPVWNMDGPDFALHSPWPHTRDDPRLGMRYNPYPWYTLEDPILI